MQENCEKVISLSTASSVRSNMVPSGDSSTPFPLSAFCVRTQKKKKKKKKKKHEEVIAVSYLVLQLALLTRKKSQVKPHFHQVHCL